MIARWGPYPVGISQIKCLGLKGEVPSILPKVTTDAVCYLSIDMNCAYPEVAAVEYFYDKLVPGGIILLDDYGFSANNKEYIHQKNAHDELAKKKAYKSCLCRLVMV